MKKSVWIGCLVVCGVSFLRAENVKERWGVGGGLGLSDFLISSEVRETTKSGTYSGAWLRYGVTERGEVLAAIDNVQAGGEDGHSMARLRPVTLNWLQSFGKSRWSPYVSAGAGPAWVRGTGETYKDRMLLSLRGGFGVERRVTDAVGIGAGMTYHYAFTDGRYAPSSAALALQLSGNYYFYCGRKPETKAVVPPPPPPAVADSDGDGVPDPRDACPGTPKGAAVDALGCPKDSDGDDVLDSDDKCPNTPPGSLVNEDGCPVVKVSVSLDVKFVTGKAALAPGSSAQLEKVAAFMKKHSDTTIVIEGHSDNVGAPAMNKRLSQQRADVVRKELVDTFGIAADRISAKGFGHESPVANNATPEGRAANRRVVATISASVVKK
jgi:OOP family OmpA-OmpF porin